MGRTKRTDEITPPVTSTLFKICEESISRSVGGSEGGGTRESSERGGGEGGERRKGEKEKRKERENPIQR